MAAGLICAICCVQQSGKDMEMTRRMRRKLGTRMLPRRKRRRMTRMMMSEGPPATPEVPAEHHELLSSCIASIPMDPAE